MVSPFARFQRPAQRRLMEKAMSIRRAIASALVVAFVAFCFWWGGAGRPLSPQERNALLSALERNLTEQTRAEAPDLKIQLQRLMDEDDGGEIYIVNLETTRPTETPEAITAAERRYAAAMLPMQLARAAVPILVARGQARIMGSAPAFDRVAVVRWRSLRDFVEVVASPDYARAAPLKWEAVQHSEIVVAKPVLSLALVRFLLGALTALAVVGVLSIGRRAPPAG